MDSKTQSNFDKHKNELFIILQRFLVGDIFEIISLEIHIKLIDLSINI